MEDAHALFESEYKQQYRSLPFWKRSVILVAGVAVNLLFAVLLFVVLFSLIGVDVQTSAGDIRHVNVNPLDAIQMGFMYIGMVVQLIAGLYRSVDGGRGRAELDVGHRDRAMSKQAVDLGLASAISFVASISVSLGIMNLLPIPPLDGGRFVIEVFQKISRKVVTMRALNYLSAGRHDPVHRFFPVHGEPGYPAHHLGCGFRRLERAARASVRSAREPVRRCGPARKSLTCARFRHRNRSKSTMSTSYVHFNRTA